MKFHSFGTVPGLIEAELSTESQNHNQIMPHRLVIKSIRIWKSQVLRCFACEKEQVVKNRQFLNNDISKICEWNFTVLCRWKQNLLQNQKIVIKTFSCMNFVCLIDWKKNTQSPPKMQKLPIFKQKNREKSKVNFFLIKAKFTTQVEHNSQNMPKCLVLLLHVEEQDRLKSHSFFLPPDFIDSQTIMNSKIDRLWICNWCWILNLPKVKLFSVYWLGYVFECNAMKMT